jgi:ABC-2 type transport system ATP-binding protein
VPVLLQVTALSKHYGAMRALDDCSFSIEPGQVVGLLGPNGSGKTTLIRMLMGFLQPTSGSATLQGLDCYRQQVDVHRLVTYLPAEARMFRFMRPLAILKFFSQIRPEGNLARAIELAEFLELDMRRRVIFMSTGMRQKLAMAACLSMDCPLAILDEPTANLDPTIRSKLLQLIRHARERGQAVLLSSHVISEVEACCDRVLMLRRGCKVFEDELTNVQQVHLAKIEVETESIEVPPSLAPYVKQVARNERGAHFLMESLDPEVLRWLANFKPASVSLSREGLQSVYDRLHLDEDAN